MQGELERVLALHSPGRRPPDTLVVAGRTDAGVHARDQVAHIDVAPGPSGELADLDRMVYRWNRMLPPDVRVFSARVVPAAFDARFSALRRHYLYRIADDLPRTHPLLRRDTLIWFRGLDIDAMNAASAKLLGEHDFVAFCKRREGATSIRDLQRLEWIRGGDGVLSGYVTADAFCHSMVRSLVGALIAVGEGRRPVDWPESLLSATERPSSVAVASAHALTLLGVDYPPDDQLAARAERTRNLRVAQ